MYALHIAALAAFRNHNGEVCIDRLSPSYSMIHVPDDSLETMRQLALFFSIGTSAYWQIELLKSYYDRPRYDCFPYCLLKCDWHAIIMEFNAQNETLYWQTI